MYTTGEDTTKLGTDNTRRRNANATEQDVLRRRKEQGTGLTLTFARDLAKHAPLGLYDLVRVVASGDRASLQ